MKSAALIIFGIFISKFSFAECGLPISKESIAKEPEPLTLGMVEKRYGEWCPGHGPVSWYKEKGGKEVWFWWKKPIQPAETKSELKKYQILFVAEVEPDDENVQKIIWPPSLVNKSADKVMQDAYK